MKHNFLIYFLTLTSFLFGETIEESSLNGEWFFRKAHDKQGITEKWQTKPLSEVFSKKLAVPGCWPIQLNNTKGEGVVWYAKTFSIPEKWNSSKLMLHFERVCLIADVWLNGKYLGKHLGAYTEFKFNINKHLHLDRENILLVRCDSTRSIEHAPAKVEWLYPGGITGSVTLQKRPFIDLVDCWLYDSHGNTQLELKINNASKTTDSGEFTVHYIKNNKKEHLIQQHFTIGPKSSKKFKHIIKKDFPLWDIDTPNLIDLGILVKTKKQNTSFKHKTGLRRLTWDNNEWKINNKRTWMQGMALHLDHPDGGQVWTEEDILKCFDRLEAFGINFLRMGHYPFPKRWLDECDKRGIAVWLEIPNWQSGKMMNNTRFQKRWLYSQLRDMIQQYKSHPCVIAWSHGNENGVDSTYYKEACDFIRQMDQTRPASFSTSPYNRKQDWQHRDIHGQITHFGWYHSKTPYRIHSYLDDVINNYPGVFLNIEVCAHSRDTVEGSYASDTRLSPAFHDKIMRTLLNAYFKNCDRVEGVTTWTLNDFLWRRDNHNIENPKTRHNSPHGIFTRDRKAKYVASTVREIYRGKVKALIIDKKTHFIKGEILNASFEAATPISIDKPIELEWRSKCWRADNVFFEKKGTCTLNKRGSIKLHDLDVEFPKEHSGLTLVSLSLHQSGVEKPINRQVAHYNIGDPEILDYRLIFAHDANGNPLEIRAGSHNELEYGDQHTAARVVLWPGKNLIEIKSDGYESKVIEVLSSNAKVNERTLNVTLTEK